MESLLEQWKEGNKGCYARGENVTCSMENYVGII